MLSTPPAMIRSASPERICRAPVAIASAPEAHSRFTVVPDTVSGSPDSRVAIRAMLRLSSPAWFALPRMTSSTAAQSTSGSRAVRVRINSAARSSGRTEDSAPPYRPNGVRVPSIRNASLTVVSSQAVQWSKSITTPSDVGYD